MNDIKLEKFFSNKNICSRSAFKKYIKDNDIIINEKKISSSVKIRDRDEIIVNGIKYIYRQYVYIIMNKPKGYVCANIDDMNSVVFDLLKEEDFQKDLFTVGRLDKDTTGLLIITNDGKFAHSIASDKKNFVKKYYAKLANKINDIEISKLSEGVELSCGYVTKPALVNKLSDTEVEIEISEGKYHQVKRMLHSVGNEVLDLERIAIGGYILSNDLLVGEYKHYEYQELKKKVMLNSKSNAQ